MQLQCCMKECIYLPVILCCHFTGLLSGCTGSIEDWKLTPTHGRISCLRLLGAGFIIRFLFYIQHQQKPSIKIHYLVYYWVGATVSTFT